MSCNPSIPAVFAHGHLAHFEYLAMELLGRDLGDMVEDTGLLKYFHLLVTRAFGVVVTHRVRRFVMRRAAVRFPARPIPFTKIPTGVACA